MNLRVIEDERQVLSLLCSVTIHGRRTLLRADASVPTSVLLLNVRISDEQGGDTSSGLSFGRQPSPQIPKLWNVGYSDAVFGIGISHAAKNLAEDTEEVGDSHLWA